uniref:long-chain-fatty-acid--CoA ligase n=1 Tax=Dermatophagoides pteronyssinus TaxID=6956 RepID=A0A6P6YFX5_DERPT|nr:long-chain-fatty-acid--CoA ligase 4-like [Dermatophagoides pteronyssinus]
MTASSTPDLTTTSTPTSSPPSTTFVMNGTTTTTTTNEQLSTTAVIMNGTGTKSSSISTDSINNNNNNNIEKSNNKNFSNIPNGHHNSSTTMLMSNGGRKIHSTTKMLNGELSNYNDNNDDEKIITKSNIDSPPETPLPAAPSSPNLSSTAVSSSSSSSSSAHTIPTGPSAFKVPADITVKLLKGLFILLVHLIVTLYTLITWPIYYYVQRPFEVVEKSKQIRSKQMNPEDPKSPWVGEFPEKWPFVLDKCEKIDDLCEYIGEYFSLKNRALGSRRVLKEFVVLGPDGKTPLRIDGRTVKKRELSDYEWITFEKMIERKNNIARGFHLAGIKRNEPIVILCETCAEYFMVELAIARSGNVQVNVFATLGDSGIAHAIRETNSKYIFTSWELLPKVRSIISHYDFGINKVIYINRRVEQTTQEMDKEAAELIKPIGSTEFVSLETIENDGQTRGEEVEDQCRPIGKDEISYIMYTSGTTGIPKGVQATSSQMIHLMRTILPVLKNAIGRAHEEMYVAYLPQAHIFEATCEFLALALGAPLGFANPFTLTDSAPGLAPGTESDLRLLKPTIMIAVPLVLERMRKEIYTKLEARSPISSPLFNYLMDYKIRWTQKGYKTPVVNKLLCKKIREQFGGQLHLLILGGAPLSASLQALIKAALNVTLVQGYGMTETLGACICMDEDDLSYGRCGRPLYGVHAKLDDWTEGDYRVTDKPYPRGELVIGSKANSLGYLMKPEMTAELYEKDDQLDITWFRTGDIAEIHPDGTFKIIDRKKDLVKLANGEYFSLGKIESILKNCSYIDNICVFGNALANYLVALIIPNANRFGRLAKSYRVPRSEATNDERLKKIVLKSLRESGLKNGLKKAEIPTKIQILSDEWTPDNGMLTAAMKLKRSMIKTKYSSIIEELFHDPEKDTKQ